MIGEGRAQPSRFDVDAGGAVMEQAVGVLIGRGAKNAAEGHRLLIGAADSSGAAVGDVAREVLNQARRRQQPSPRQRAATYAELDEALNADPEPDLPALVAGLAADRIPGATTASVTMVNHTHYRTAAATSPLAEEVDGIQYAQGEGPCVEVMQTGVTGSATTNVAIDPRWPAFAAHATQVGVRAALCFRLNAKGDRTARAALNVYATDPGSFAYEAVALGMVLAAQAGRVLTASSWQARAAYLQHGLETNREVGMAMGILMAHNGLTKTAAFDLLRHVSHRTNRKLRDIATDVVETGTLADQFTYPA